MDDPPPPPANYPRKHGGFTSTFNKPSPFVRSAAPMRSVVYPATTPPKKAPAPPEPPQCTALSPPCPPRRRNSLAAAQTAAAIELRRSGIGPPPGLPPVPRFDPAPHYFQPFTRAPAAQSGWTQPTGMLKSSPPPGPSSSGTSMEAISRQSTTRLLLQPVAPSAQQPTVSSFTQPSHTATRKAT